MLNKITAKILLDVLKRLTAEGDVILEWHGGAAPTYDEDRIPAELKVKTVGGAYLLSFFNLKNDLDTVFEVLGTSAAELNRQFELSTDHSPRWLHISSRGGALEVCEAHSHR